jgi:hypothetical protein
MKRPSNRNPNAKPNLLKTVTQASVGMKKPSATDSTAQRAVPKVSGVRLLSAAVTAHGSGTPAPCAGGAQTEGEERARQRWRGGAGERGRGGNVGVEPQHHFQRACKALVEVLAPRGGRRSGAEPSCGESAEGAAELPA